MVNASTSSQFEIVTSHDVKFPVDPEIITTPVVDKLRKQHYESAEARGLPRFVRETDRVLEIGAGIGFISSFVATKLGVASIDCVEANPVLVDYIKTVHQENGISNATVHNAVLLPDNADMPANGTIPFHVTDPFWSSSFENPKALPSKLVDAPAKRLSQMIAECDPTVIICDIEGGEVQIFEQVDFGKVEFIYIEVHRRYISPHGVKKVFEDLHRHDFAYRPNGSDGMQVLFQRLPARRS